VAVTDGLVDRVNVLETKVSCLEAQLNRLKVGLDFHTDVDHYEKKSKKPVKRGLGLENVEEVFFKEERTEQDMGVLKE
jgi:hypothetical protein